MQNRLKEIEQHVRKHFTPFEEFIALETVLRKDANCVKQLNMW